MPAVLREASEKVKITRHIFKEEEMLEEITPREDTLAGWKVWPRIEKIRFVAAAIVTIALLVVAGIMIAGG